ncbi:SIR2 family protein [Sorangium sp. So ce1182]|uniref:SIR2 family protein n=1 Tax=Sorangium sp. So ce1182 TaxID=3133334 RepID=UPI003F6175CA
MALPASDLLPDVPTELIEAGASGHLVVLVGAGASRDARLPDWNALLDELLAMARVEVTRPAARGDLEAAASEWSSWKDALTKASLLGQTMGDAWLQEAIARRFKAASASPTPTHRALAALPGAAFVTTNYDRLLEAALAERTGRPPRTLLLSNTGGLQSFAVGDVLKLHGDVGDPKSIVLMREDYYRVGHEAPRAWKERLKAVLQPPYQLVLVGYGYGDVDVQEVVNELRGAYEGQLLGPFWLERMTLPARTKAQAFHLRPIWLRDHAHGVPWLEALARAIEARRNQAPAVVRAVAYAGQVRKDFKEKNDRAHKRFVQQDYAEARVLYEQMLVEAEGLLTADPDDPELKAWIARSRLNVGACLLRLQEHAKGRAHLRQVAERELVHLTVMARCVLSEGLAQVGDLDLARAVLPVCDDALSEEERTRWVEARQLLDVLTGKLPERECSPSAVVGVHVARAHEKRGQLDEAARAARRVLEQAPDDADLSVFSVAVLVGSLRRSVLEDPSAIAWMPPGDRAPTVDAIERGLSRVGELPLAPALRSDVARLKLVYCGMAEDHEGLEEARRACEEGAAGAIEISESPAMSEAEALAEAGDLEGALRRLPPTDHPWRGRFARAQLAVSAERYEQALDEALGLARDFPGRVPIEYLAAMLLARAARPEDALPHARAAFAALPGKGYRLLLGKCLLYCDQAEEAWQILSPLSDSREPDVLRARAMAAERVRPEQAPALWSEYLKGEPNSAPAALSLARAWLRLGHAAEAAKVAWRLVESAKDRLDPESLYHCAQMQRLDGGFSEEARRRVQEIAAVLDARFPGDPGAEHARLMLLAALGFPEEARPVDYQRLLDEGILRTGSLDDLKAFVTENRERQQTAYRLYRHGHLPFEAFCELTETAAASWLIQFLRVSGEGPTTLSAPLELGDTPPPPLAGQRLLVGELELLLLQHLGHLARLRDALKPGGKLVLFTDVWERVLQAAADLELRTQRVELENQERLLRRIQDDRKIEAHKAGLWSEQGLPVIHHEPLSGAADRISPRAFAHYLGAQGYLDDARAHALLGWLPPEQEPLPSVPDPMPPRVSITAVMLECFENAAALDALLAVIPEALVLDPATMTQLGRRCDALRAAAEAADLAATMQRAVGAGIAEGWIAPTLRRPAVADLPDVRDDSDLEDTRRLFREPLAQALGFRQALVDDPTLLLLNADFFISTAPASVLARPLAWRDAEQFRRLAARMRAVSAREIHLPALVAGLLLEPEAEVTKVEVTKKLVRLAELGFADALRARDVLDLHRRFRGLDKAEPRRILDRLEWMAREREHPGSGLAHLRIAGVYAKAVWAAFCQSDGGGSEADAKALAGALLQRTEVLGEATTRGTVDLVFQFLAAAAIDDPRASFVPQGRGSGSDGLTVSPESPAGQLWTFLASWTGPAGRRRSALARGLRETWRILDEQHQAAGPARAQLGAVMLSMHVQGRGLLDPELESVAILSAGWQERPLEHLAIEEGQLSIEQALSAGANALASRPDAVSGNMRYVDYPIRVPGSKAETRTIAPTEAILLRSAPVVIESFAEQLAALQGPLDGRAYRLLMQIKEAPEDQSVRRRYARMTVVAPWRLVREDPAVLRTWRWRRGIVHDAFPATIDHLREMLSEPGPLPPELSLLDILGARVTKDGAWAERADQEDLCRQACEVPGLLPTFVVYSRLSAEEDAYSEEVQVALDRLDDPHEQPAARLAGDIFFLRVAAARRPFVRLPEGESDLRERLPGRLLSVLKAMAMPQLATFAEAEIPRSGPLRMNERKPPLGDFAEAEGDLLRLCALVVEELALPEQLPFRDGLWLTYRLFQWLCVQLEALAPDARSAGLTTLRNVAPPAPVLAADDDLLNPFRFARDRFDHRLATVLYAFGFMEELLLQVPGGAADRKISPHSVSSTELEEMLASLAARPLSDDERALRARGDEPSCLGWHGPGVIPDLALMALLHLNGGAFFRIPAPRRLGWIEAMRQHPHEPARLTWSLTSLLLSSVVNQAERLSPEEKVALEDRLRAMAGDPGGKALIWRWLGFTALHGAGCEHLGGDVQHLLLEQLSNPAAPEAFGRYLTALSSRAQDRLEGEAMRILEAAEAAGLDPVPFTWGIARVIAHGNPDAIPAMRALLQQLAQRAPFEGDGRMRSLLGNLGLL